MMTYVSHKKILFEKTMKVCSVARFFAIKAGRNRIQDSVSLRFDKEWVSNAINVPTSVYGATLMH